MRAGPIEETARAVTRREMRRATILGKRRRVLVYAVHTSLIHRNMFEIVARHDARRGPANIAC